MPVYDKNEIVGTIGWGRNISQLLKQQAEIEELFLSGRTDEGINKFFSYHQQFKTLKNIKLKK